LCFNGLHIVVENVHKDRHGGLAAKSELVMLRELKVVRVLVLVLGFSQSHAQQGDQERYEELR
jgi:hypothetical protein